MMGVQQVAIQASNAQMQAFMTLQAQFQQAMYEQQARANNQKQKANRPNFMGAQMKIWSYGYSTSRNILPPTPISKKPTTLALWTWSCHFWELMECRVANSNQRRDARSSETMVYQQNPRADTSAYVSQTIPETLQDTMEYAQRFEDSRKQSRPKQHQPASSAPTGRNDTRNQFGRNKTPPPNLGASPATAASPHPGPATTTKPIFEPTCHKCGVQGHKAPGCPSRDNGATQ
ncbi:unnamed protein product [Phytophthora lilii]|uniref:Unnamed protein product n=1 Tax=Phytophthora lilii TaxID=2077276 RepID=A0A9W6UC43_9STRA|nr:unnamed protein product [Phytophthora lilii]